jgi:putative transposase
MAARNVAGPVVLDSEQREQLESFSRSRSLAHAHVQRAKIVLLAADGMTNIEIAEKLGTTRETVGKWRKRYLQHGIEGIYDELRTGRPRTYSDEQIATLIQRTLDTTPDGSTHWSTRSMAKEIGISKSTVHRVWTTFALQPHRQTTFKLSNDPFFVEKVRDIVGLYLDPPQHAVVMCVDEKSQCQALERSQPMLPMNLGYVEGVTHDYVRHGTTTLFAALDIANGQVLTDCKPRHRHQEFLSFLRLIDKNVPQELDVHVILDNYATHKHAQVKAWLVKHERFRLHFTPTYSSWLNQVERWFGLITERAIRRGSFSSVKELIAKIQLFVDAWNRDSVPFAWHATADSIFAKIQRLCESISGTAH